MASSNVKKMTAEKTGATEETRTLQQAQTDRDRNAKIAEMAYYKAEQRGFEPGHEQADWFEAEREYELMQKGTPEA